MAALASVVVLTVAAEAQPLSKRGTYTSTFAYHGVWKVYEGDKDHLVVAGDNTGVNLTDGGQPFLHQAAVVCPYVVEVSKGVGTSQGHCIATDRDGDKAFIVFKCRSSQPGARCEGDFQWTVVFAGVGDPAGTGIVASLALPGGNITGVTHIPRDIMGKRLGLLVTVAADGKAK